MKLSGRATAILIATMGAVAASAATPQIVAAVNARKANYKEIGGAFKTINDEIKSGNPDMNAVKTAARDIAARAPQQLKYFPKGSGPESGIKTRAKAVIWADQATFLKGQQELVAASAALQTAAMSGDGAALASARTRTAAACKSCHDRFREED